MKEESFPLLFMSTFLVFIGCVFYYDIHRQYLREVQCKALHHGQDFTEEKVLAKTKEGCIVSEVRVFDGNTCFQKHYFEVTDCASVCWSESHGKYSVKKCNLNE